MNGDDLRRFGRVSVCCRVEVRDRFGVWTAVTEDFGARGCRLLTNQLPRRGSLLTMRLSSDLFPEELEVRARAVWGTLERIGVAFLESPAREGALSPADFLELVVEHGRPGPGIRAVDSPRLVPVIGRGQASAPLRQDIGRPVQPPRAAVNDTVRSLPVRGG